MKEVRMQDSQKVFVIELNHRGDLSGEQEVAYFEDFNWQARKLVVTVDEQMAMSYREFCDLVHHSPRAVPEVVLFPPLAGGR
jgi:hypothetical protein